MSDAASERGRIVSWLLCEAFERRFTPDTAAVYSTAADAIASGRHYSDNGRDSEDPLRVITCTVRAEVMEKLAASALQTAEEIRREAVGS